MKEDGGGLRGLLNLKAHGSFPNSSMDGAGKPHRDIATPGYASGCRLAIKVP
jgi:hypothetical protein